MICEDAPIEEVRRQFALTALYVCEQVERYQPDLVIGLAHSGCLPIELAHGLWAQTRSRSFPPTIRTNFGREKTAIFERWRYEQAALKHFYVGTESPEETVQALVWLETQQHWKTEMTAQIQTVCPNILASSRVLVVDDFVAGGLTSLLLLGLLASLNPKTESRLIDADLDGWKERLAVLWLEQFYPEILAKIEQTKKQETGKGSPESLCPLVNQIARLAPGTEDIQLDSLQWRSIGPDSPCLRGLSDLLPAQSWLALIAWVAKVREESIHTALKTSRVESGPTGNWFPRLQVLPNSNTTPFL